MKAVDFTQLCNQQIICNFYTQVDVLKTWVFKSGYVDAWIIKHSMMHQFCFQGEILTIKIAQSGFWMGHIITTEELSLPRSDKPIKYKRA